MSKEIGVYNIPFTVFKHDDFHYILENNSGDIFVGAGGNIYLRRRSLMNYEQPHYLERCAVCGKEPILKPSPVIGDGSFCYCCDGIHSKDVSHNIGTGFKKSEKEARDEWNKLMLAIKNIKHDGK